MILSGSQVLLMDPRRKYLERNRSCYGPISLKKMKRYVKYAFQNSWHLVEMMSQILSWTPLLIAWPVWL